MTQPLPDAAAQRAAALDVYAVYEPTLYQGYLDMIAQWLAAVRVAMFTGGVTQLALMPDPFTVFAKTPEWNKLVTSYGDTIVRGVLAEPYAQILGDDTVFATRPFVHNWIADRQNKLAKTPTEVFGLVKTIVDNATSNGASIPDVADQIHDLLDATHGEQWKNRAQTVARTEVVGAYNGGLHDAFGMITDAQPDRSYFKRWLATDDTHTRPDHREADGQLVPWSQPFIVGGFPMMHPHDPAAPAHEVINCRCTELLELEGEPTDMGNRQYLDAAVQTLKDIRRPRLGRLADMIPSNRVWKPGDRVGLQPLNQTPNSPYPQLGTVQQITGRRVMVKWDNGDLSVVDAANLSREHHILGRSP